MDTKLAKKSLGETGLAGVVLLAVGLAVLGRENRRAALGALVVVVGYSLVGHGLVGSFLNAMGMEYDDLY